MITKIYNLEILGDSEEVNDSEDQEETESSDDVEEMENSSE